MIVVRLELASYLDGLLELGVFPLFERIALKFDFVIRLDTLSFKAVSVPRVKSHDGDSKYEFVANFESRSDPALARQSSCRQ